MGTLIHEPHEWYVAFVRVPTARWIKCFTGNNFSHVFTFGYVPPAHSTIIAGEGTWIVVDWCRFGLRVQVRTGEEIDTMIAALREIGTVLAYTPEPYERREWRLPIWCVAAVKHQLGLRCWAFTPQQLFCELRRRGARTMFADT